MASQLDSAAVYTNFSGLSALRREAKSNSPEALRKTAQQFEAIFLQMVLKSMRDASPGGGLFDSYQGKFYRGMFDQQIALTMSEGKGIGLTDVIVRQLQRSVPHKDGKDSADSQAAAVNKAPPPELRRDPSLTVPSARAPATPSAPVAAAPTAAGFDSPVAFVRAIWKHALHAANQLGLSPQAVVAQAALETGWGKHMLAQADGRPSYNLFGIKADDGWSGDRVAAVTTEFDQGVMSRENAQFRAYPSLEAGFNDYVRFLRSDPRYQAALGGQAKPQDFGQALRRAGYATDPAYGAKIRSIMEGDTLRQALASLSL